MAVFNNTPECNCLPGSNVFEGRDPGAGPGVPAMCAYNATPIRRHSPMRDWWSGYPGTPMPAGRGSPQHGMILASLERRAMRLAARREMHMQELAQDDAALEVHTRFL